MVREKRYIYIKVEFLNGTKGDYLLPRDLQSPMWYYISHNKSDWRELLSGALINVPIRPYVNHETTIRVAKIDAQFIKTRNKGMRSRSQFIIRNNWYQVSLKQLILSRRFLRHDFSLKNKFLITIDLLRWWSRSKWKGK